MSLLPEPQSITPAEIPELCQQVEHQALATDDPQLVVDLHAKWSAITEYLQATSTEGIAEAKATKLRLFTRIGELSPAQPSGRAARLNPGTGNETALPKNRMTEARKLANNPDVVDDVIAAGTDDRPPSKAQALRQIEEKANATMRPSDRSQATKARATQARRLARAGLGHKAIAEQLAVSPSTVSKYLGEVDRGSAGQRAAIDRITNGAVGLAMAADQTSGDVIDPEEDEVARWTGDLTKAIRALSQLRTRINKEKNQQ